MPAARRILVVDDDPGIRAYLGSRLVELGYKTDTAANGQEALVILGNAVLPDAIILDLMMPVMGGWEFLEVKAGSEAIRTVPVFVMTGLRHEPVQLKHVVGLYQKPGGLGDMLDTLKRHLPPSN